MNYVCFFLKICVLFSLLFFRDSYDLTDGTAASSSTKSNRTSPRTAPVTTRRLGSTKTSAASDRSVESDRASGGDTDRSGAEQRAGENDECGGGREEARGLVAAGTLRGFRFLVGIQGTRPSVCAICVDESFFFFFFPLACGLYCNTHQVLLQAHSLLVAELTYEV